MSVKNKVIVKIMGQEYTLKSEDSREYMQRVANLVDDRMGAIGEANKKLSTSMVAVLTALNVADDYVKLLNNHDDACKKLENPTIEVKLLREELALIKKVHEEKILECENLMVEFNKQAKNSADYEQGLTGFRTKIQELTQSLEDKNQEVEQFKAVAADFDRQKEDLEIEMDGLRDLVAIRENTIENLKADLVVKQSEKERLKAELDEFISTFDSKSK